MGMGLRRMPGVEVLFSVELVGFSGPFVVEGAVEGAVVAAVEVVEGAVDFVVDWVVVLPEGSVVTLPLQPQAVIMDAISRKVAMKIPAFFIVSLLVFGIRNYYLPKSWI